MNPEVTNYINNLKIDWQRDVVTQLRHLIHRADSQINETVRWGTPAFDHSGPVVWLFCANDWVHFAFIQGVLLDDSHGLFEEKADSASKAKRTIKIKEGDKIPSAPIAQLIKQAVANNLVGKKIKFKPEPKKPVILPDDMKAKLRSAGLEDDYWKRPYYQQKGYIQWVGEAKHDETRQKRIRTMIEELEGDSYMPPKRNK